VQIPIVVDQPVGNRLQIPLGFIGAEFTLKEPIAVTEFKARSLLTKMDYVLFGTGSTLLLDCWYLVMLSFCTFRFRFVVHSFVYCVYSSSSYFSGILFIQKASQ